MRGYHQCRLVEAALKGLGGTIMVRADKRCQPSTVAQTKWTQNAAQKEQAVTGKGPAVRSSTKQHVDAAIIENIRLQVPLAIAKSTQLCCGIYGFLTSDVHNAFLGDEVGNHEEPEFEVSGIRNDIVIQADDFLDNSDLATYKVYEWAYGLLLEDLHHLLLSINPTCERVELDLIECDAIGRAEWLASHFREPRRVTNGCGVTWRDRIVARLLTYSGRFLDLLENLITQVTPSLTKEDDQRFVADAKEYIKKTMKCLRELERWYGRAAAADPGEYNRLCHDMCPFCKQK